MRQNDPHGHLFPPLQLSLRGIRSDLDLLVNVPDAWLASHSRFVETDALGWRLAHHRLPIELLLFSASEVEEHRHGRTNVIAEAFRFDPARVAITPGRIEGGGKRGKSLTAEWPPVSPRRRNFGTAPLPRERLA